MNVFLPFSFHVRRAQMNNGVFVHAPGPKSAYGFAEALFYKIMGESGLSKIKSLCYCGYDIEVLGEEAGVFSMNRIFSKIERERKEVDSCVLDIIEQAESKYAHAPLFRKWTPWVQNANALDMPAEDKYKTLPAAPTLRQLAVCDMQVALIVEADIDDLSEFKKNVKKLLDTHQVRFAGGAITKNRHSVDPVKPNFLDKNNNPFLSFRDAFNALPSKARYGWWVCDASREVEQLAKKEGVALDEAAMLLGAGLFPQESAHYGINLIGYHTIEGEDPVERVTTKGWHPHLYVEPVYGAVKYQKFTDTSDENEFVWRIHRENGFFHVSNQLKKEREDGQES